MQADGTGLNDIILIVSLFCSQKKQIFGMVFVYFDRLHAPHTGARRRTNGNEHTDARGTGTALGAAMKSFQRPC